MKLCVSLFLLMLSTPALAWEAGFDGPLCTLEHDQSGAQMRLTYNPAGPLYTITVTSPQAWSDSPYFGIQFQGPSPNIITTDRHSLSESRDALSVSDRGFGNVLNGLSDNEIALAFTPNASIAFDLEGAAPAVAAFEACVTRPLA